MVPWLTRASLSLPLTDHWHPIEDDAPLIERDVPPVIYRLERAWRCRAVRLGEAFGGLWAFTRGDKQAASFGFVTGQGEALDACALGAAWPLVALSGLPLILVVGDAWARVAAPDRLPPSEAFRPV